MTRRNALYAIRAQSDPLHVSSRCGPIWRDSEATSPGCFRTFLANNEHYQVHRLILPVLIAMLLCLTLLIPIVFCPAQGVAATPFFFDSSPLKKRAMQLLDEGRFLESADAWGTVYTFSLFPADRAEALVRIGDVYALFLDMPGKALETYANAIRTYPGRSELENAYFNAGMLLYETGQYAQAQSYFRSYIGKFPRGTRRSTSEFMLERLHEEMAAGQPVPPGADMDTTPALQRGQEPRVRVAIANAAAVSFSLSGDVAVAGMGTLHRGAYTIVDTGNSLLLNKQPVGGRFALSLPAGLRLQVGESAYEGAIVFQSGKGNVLVVNTLGIETYLEGVLPREMPSSFGENALQAQAVAARSYTMYLMGKSQDKPYDVSGSTASQVYGGVGVGTARTRNAVMQTRGRVLTYAGRIALTYFHSHSGGMLEDDKLVWTADMPYYLVREDGVSNRARTMRWQTTISAYEVAQRMRVNGFTVSSINDIRVGTLSASGRMATIVVETPDPAIEMKANSFRLMMGAEQMKSTLCNVQRTGDAFIFRGIGYGHGVGMSQWGAQGMAQEGNSVERILAHYYPGTSLATLY